MNEEMKKKFTDALKEHVGKFSNTPKERVSEQMLKLVSGISMNTVFLAAHADVLVDRKEIVAVLTALSERLYRMESESCPSTLNTPAQNAEPASS